MLLRRQRSGGSQFEASSGKDFTRPYLEKYPNQKMAGRVAQVIECLPSKSEALSSDPALPNKTKQNKKLYQKI
jgi:hypothetical protein